MANALTSGPHPTMVEAEEIKALASFPKMHNTGLRPGASGLVRFQCPASAGRVACPVKPQSLRIASSKGVIVPTNVPAAGAQGDVCRQATITVDLDHPDANTRAMGYIGGLYQKHPFGSDAWYDSMRRRSYVESSYANVKSEAEQSLRRPSMRTMGRTRMTFWSVFVTAAANLRLGRIWVRRQQRKHHPEQGPAISPAMRQAAQARQRTLGRRRRQEREKAARARGRPPD